MKNEEVRVLVQLYKESRFLWDSNDERFFIKKAREEAWKIIAQKMNLPVKVLKDKITSLMGSYRREKSREKRSSTYRSRWFAFKWFNFLTDRQNTSQYQHNTTPAVNMADSAKEQKFTTTDLNDTEERTDDNEDEQEPVPPKKRNVTKAKPKKRLLVDTSLLLPDVVGELTNVIDRIDGVIQEHEKNYHREDDIYDLYGKILAKRLRQFPPRDGQELMHEIDGLVLRRAPPAPIPEAPLTIVIKKQLESPDNSYISPTNSP